MSSRYLRAPKNRAIRQTLLWPRRCPGGSRSVRLQFAYNRQRHTELPTRQRRRVRRLVRHLKTGSPQRICIRRGLR